MYTDVFEYGYLENSNLIHTITFPNNISVTNTYEPNRDYLTQKTNRHDTTIVSQYTYQYDAIGRRINQMDYGTAFENHFKLYNYNERSELNGATKYFGANLSDLSNPDTTYNYSYNYDNVGNRLTSSDAQSASGYVPNDLNQYASVATDSQSVSLSYDDDGNMLSYGGWDYAWNAENQLISAIKNADKKVELAYDYIGRRISKKIYSWNLETSHWACINEFYFLYDDWNLIVEFELTIPTSHTNLKKTYTWGLDIFVSWQDSGGVGGLLSVFTCGSQSRYYPHYDGNGNIIAYLNALGGIFCPTIYKPFGDSISGIADNAICNMGFSTKYADDGLGLVYYGYRYYLPRLGRWLNRDPLIELGHTLAYPFDYVSNGNDVTRLFHATLSGEKSDIDNLYVFVDNCPVSTIDILGLAKEFKCGSCKVCVEDDHSGARGGKHVHYNCTKGAPSCRGNGAASLPNFGPSHGHTGNEVPKSLKKCIDRKMRYKPKDIRIKVPVAGTGKKPCCKEETYKQLVADTVTVGSACIVGYAFYKLVKTCAGGTVGFLVAGPPGAAVGAGVCFLSP